MTTLNIAGIVGSLRKDSYNKKLMRAAGQLMPEGMQLTILSIEDIPLYNSDIDIPDVKDRPLPVDTLCQGIAQADGLLIISPEYNYSIPGVLKNALDWASRGAQSPLLNKPVSLMGATMGAWGTTRGQLAFYPFFQCLNMHLIHKPEVFVAQVQTKFDNQGHLVDDFTKDIISKNLQALQAYILHQRR